MPKQIVATWIVLWALAVGSAAAVEYPGPAPGPARGQCTATEAVLSNNVIAVRWTFAGGRLRLDRLWDKQSGASAGIAGGECFSLILGQTPDPGTRTLKASELKLAAAPELKQLQPASGSARLGDRFGGWELSARLILRDPDVEVCWRAVLRDGANYVRQQVTIRAQGEPLELVEAVLLELPVPQAAVIGQVDGSPIVGKNLFLGVEHPASSSRVVGSDTARCSYPFHGAVTPGDPLALSSIVGVAPPGQGRRGFLHYLERERAHPFRPFLHHNNGEQLGLTYWKLFRKAPAEAAKYRARQEREWCELIDRVGQELVERRGAQIDAFAHDHVWDDEKLCWQFHNGFPHGFVPVAKTAARYKSDLGVWLSPFGGYASKAARLKYGPPQGLERNQAGLSLAGPRYYARFRAACLNLLRHHDAKYFKFDGFTASIERVSEYRSDVEALWRLMGELRQADPEVFINPSTGTWPSPFWLLRADSIWRGGSDTGLAGAKGSERQQWITYRDFEIRNRVIAKGPLYPISSLMIHGIMINSGGRVKTFHEPDMLDEIRSFFATGVNLQELYISPELMPPKAWDVLAEAARWSRANADVLADTHWIAGDPAKGEIYGWASWAKRKGILSLRNPSDQPATVAIDVAEAFELPAGASRAYSLRSPWKKDAGLAPIRLVAGQRHEFKLQPFEVWTFDASPEP